MAATNIDICIRVTVNDPQGKPLGGTVSLEFQPRVAPSPGIVKAADASTAPSIVALSTSGAGMNPQSAVEKKYAR